MCVHNVDNQTLIQRNDLIIEKLDKTTMMTSVVAVGLIIGGIGMGIFSHTPIACLYILAAATVTMGVTKITGNYQQHLIFDNEKLKKENALSLEILTKA